MERNAGTTIFGRLELIREEASSVGVQVFGPTWAVLDSETGELARACFLDAELLPDAASRDAFVAGLEAMTSLRDPTLVPQIYAGAGEHGGAVVYEALAGGVSFDDLYDGTGSFDLSSEVGRLARQLARALEALHARGQVHGLLTSACVFVGSRGPAVYQFGLAPLCDRTVLLRRVRAFGLPNLAPEVVAGGDFTPAADLYAWAVTLAQFAAGTRGPAAIDAARSAQELPGLSPALRTALQSCLSDDPAGRPRDGAELLRPIEIAGLDATPRSDESAADRAITPESAEPEAARSTQAPVASAVSAALAATPAPAEPVVAPATPAASAAPTSSPGEPSPPSAHTAAALHPSPPAPVAVPTAAAGAVPAFVPLLPAMKPAVPPRPPTLPPAPPGAHAAVPRPPAPPAKGPPTIPPIPRSLPITSFEERLTADERPRRPATVPPGSMTASPAPSPGPAAPSSPAPAYPYPAVTTPASRCRPARTCGCPPVAIRALQMHFLPRVSSALPPLAT